VVRLVKRYGGGSRKLYDTEESRYISLEEVAEWVRDGQDVRVLESGSGEDVTRQVLAQIILDGEKQGKSVLSVDLFHDVIRRGEAALQARVEQLQESVDRLVKASVDHLPPVRGAWDEMEALREGIAGLEQALRELEEPAPKPRSRKRKSGHGARRSRADG
jgi:polyhydroxyalkanoate synthesis repressor PhaR